MFVIDPKEAAAGAVAVRDRIEGDLGPMDLSAAIEKLATEVSSGGALSSNPPPRWLTAGSANEY